jgi:hypothetical protein
MAMFVPIQFSSTSGMGIEWNPTPPATPKPQRSLTHHSPDGYVYVRASSGKLGIEVRMINLCVCGTATGRKPQEEAILVISRSAGKSRRCNSENHNGRTEEMQQTIGPGHGWPPFEGGQGQNASAVTIISQALSVVSGTKAASCDPCEGSQKFGFNAALIEILVGLGYREDI